MLYHIEESLLESAGVFSWEYKISTGILCFSNGFEKKTGIKVSSVNSFHDYLSFVSPNDKSRIKNNFKLLESGDHTSIQTNYKINGVNNKSFEVRDVAKKTDEDTLKGVSVLTEIKSTSKKLSEHDFLMVANINSRDFTVQSVNSTFLMRTGYKSEELLGKKLSSVGVFRDDFDKSLTEVISTDQYVSKSSLSMTLKDGRQLNVYSSFEHEKNNGRDFIRFFGIDLSFIAILNTISNDFFRILQNSPSTIVVTDKNAVIEYVNPKFTQLTGYQLEDVIGRKTNLLKSGFQSDDFYKGMWKSLHEQGYWEGEFNNLRKDGSTFWESARISSIRGSGGDISRFIKFGEDVTERKESEIALHIENNILTKLHVYDAIETQLNWILEVITETIELTSGAIYLCNEYSSSIPFAVKNLSKEEELFFGKILTNDNFRSLLDEGDAIFTKLGEMSSFTSEELKESSLKACGIIPVTVNSTLHGAIYLCSSQYEFIYEHLRHILTRIQPFIAHTILLAKEKDNAQKSQLDLSLAFSSVDAGTWVYKIPDDRLELKEVNNWEEILGYKASDFPEISINTWLTLIHEEDRIICSQEFQNAIINKEDYKLEYRIKHGSGKWLWVSAHGKITRFDSSGNPLEMHGIIYDITKLKENEERLKEAQNIANLGYWEYSFVTNKVTWSDEVYHIFCQPLHDDTFTYERFFEIVYPEDREIILRNYTESIEKGVPFDLVFRLSLQNNQIRYIHARCNTEYGSNGAPVISKGIVLDITEREIVKQKLELSEQKFRLLTENTRDGLLIFEAGRITYMSPAYKRMMGYDDEYDESNLDLLSITHAEDIDKVSQNLYGSIAQRKNEVMYQFRARKADGTYFWREDSAKFLYDDRGIYNRAHIVARDISKQKEAEKKLVIANTEKSAILNALPDMLFIFNKDGKIIASHSASDTSLYTSPEIFLNKNVREVLPEEISIITIQNIKRVLKTREIEIYSYKLEVEDEIRYFDSRMVYIDSGRAMAIVRDITANVKLTNELIKAKEDAEKSEILKSEFLAQMSHEIRTPVGAIMSYSQILREYINSELEEVGSIYEGIERSGKRIIRTINLILNTSEIETGSYDFNPQELDLKDDIFTPLLAEFKYLAELKNLEFRVDIPAGIKVFVDEYSFMQVFGNLIDNALKYTERGYVKVNAEKIEEQCVKIVVSDSGIGISNKYIPQLFNAFTQEETGYSRKFEGTGLGLKLVKEYCSMNKAKISVESQKGKGSKFIVKIAHR
ncbi:MAG: hypothetical protein SCALA702_37200 [Melioribacteraceae bacterium]|nr:MAG: hypothetical protein SCALA702_37200 [Melioribacteraceae bacterium]